MFKSFCKPIEQQTKEELLQGIRTELAQSAHLNWIYPAMFIVGFGWSGITAFTGDYKSGIIFALLSSTCGLVTIDLRQKRIILKMFKPSPDQPPPNPAKATS